MTTQLRPETHLVPPLPGGLPRRAWRVAEVAEMLGISEDSVYRLLTDGSIAWIPARNLKLIPVDEFERFMAEARQKGA